MIAVTPGRTSQTSIGVQKSRCGMKSIGQMLPGESIVDASERLKQYKQCMQQTKQSRNEVFTKEDKIELDIEWESIPRSSQSKS